MTMTAERAFIPSAYQQAVFDALEENVFDLQINAVAGSGKSTTLIQALSRIPYDILTSTLLCAFNKEIQTELEKKAPREVTVKTLHALGYAAIGAYLQRTTGRRATLRVDDRKYRRLIESYWLENFRTASQAPDVDEEELYKLIHFCRVTLTNPNDRGAVEAMAEERELELSRPERQLSALPRIMAEGSDLVNGMESGVIDFDDMVYLPFALNAPPKKFRLVMVDECQDLNSAQLWLVMNARADGGRMVFVGDPRQAIYGFCGADADSWGQIQTKTGARQLPLSVCYRCPLAVIEQAQAIVPEIQPTDSAERGVVETIKSDTFRALVNNHDMVLCRVNAPLISMAFALIAEGKPAKVRGRDIGSQLIKLIDTLAKQPGFDFRFFMETSEKYRSAQDALLRRKQESDAKITSLHDRVDSIQAVYSAVMVEGGTSVADLRAKITGLFVDHENGFVLLSSIHRAKGLEADRVYLLRPDKLPHPMAQSAAAGEQETNLRYVAITRARRELYFVQPDPEER